MIGLIADHEDGEVKTAMIRTLAGYMKQQYLIWNKDKVSDETIFQDIERLSMGRIQVPEGLQIARFENNGGGGRPNNGQNNGQGKSNRNRKNQKNRKQFK